MTGAPLLRCLRGRRGAPQFESFYTLPWKIQILISERKVFSTQQINKRESFTKCNPFKEGVYFKVFTSWPRGNVAANKTSLYLPSWQHGSVATEKYLWPRGHPATRVIRLKFYLRPLANAATTWKLWNRHFPLQVGYVKSTSMKGENEINR